MKIRINKKEIKIIALIIALIVIVIVGKNICEIVNTNIQISNTEKKLKQLNCEELEDKLIAKLKNTKINLNKNFSAKELVVSNIDLKLSPNSKFRFDTEIYKNVENSNMENWVIATVTCKENNNFIGKVQIPCFKIEKDNNGKFQNIHFVQNFFNIFNFEEYIKEMFKEDYGISCELFGWNNYAGKYITNFWHNHSNIDILSDNNNVLFMTKDAMELIPSYKERLLIHTFGLESKEDNIETNNSVSDNNNNNKSDDKFYLEDVKLGEFAMEPIKDSPSTKLIVGLACENILRYWPNAQINSITIKENDGYGRFWIISKFLKSETDKTYSYSHNVIEITVDTSKKYNVGNARIYLDEGTGATGVKNKSNWGTPINNN